MGLKCRGEVLKAGKHPGCRTRVLSWSIPSCFPRPCAEVGRELCQCQVLDLCLPGGVQSFCGQSSLEKTSNTAHLPASSSLNLSPKGCAHSWFPTMLSCLLSSPVLPVQRAFKQVEVMSLTCLHSRNGAGTPVLALQPGTQAGAGLAQAQH